jgi:hypothetical protein
MSDRMTFGITFLEKISGIIIATIGALLAYYTYNSPDLPVLASFFFLAAGLILAVLGLILLIAKTG